MRNNIELISVQELFGMKFFIPSYQRGYRWKKQQVKDLLNDILEFQTNGSKGIYCIQPLVVKGIPKDNAIETIGSMYEYGNKPSTDDIREALEPDKWEVIDGQQRLTTVHLILSYLYNNNTNNETFTIEYETRKITEQEKQGGKKGSQEFLEEISKVSEKDSNDNADFHHMFQAFNAIKKWFEGYTNEDGIFVPSVCKNKENFLRILKVNVKFIWYETHEEDPIKVFTRLNIGKIALTDSELIKALFLNQTNFKTQNQDAIRLQQVEIANEWDKIEYTLQNDEFWLFIQNETKYNKATRIDFILDLIREQKIYGESGDCGDDEHKTFRYFYNHFSQNKATIDAEWLRKKWLRIKEVFQIFEEWYNDLEMYHYVGFLVDQGESIQSLINEYQINKKDFKNNKILPRIKIKLNNCRDLNRIYGEDGGEKRECFPLLLLFNIQTVINQNSELVKSEKYKIGTFYKFPFHLFKREAKRNIGKGWDVEHIASNAGDDLEGDNQKIWLAAVKYSLPPDSDLKTKIEDFIKADEPVNFNALKQEIDKLDTNPILTEDKQKVWNYTILDSSTNKEYQNDPFPIKRICLLTKEQGHKAKVYFDEMQKEIVIDRTQKAISFVPPCTKNIFTKAYTDNVNSFSAWSLTDAMAYKQAIYETLKEFDITF